MDNYELMPDEFLHEYEFKTDEDYAEIKVDLKDHILVQFPDSKTKYVKHENAENLEQLKGQTHNLIQHEL